MEDSAKLGRQLRAVNVRLELVHCGYQFELKSNTASDKYSSRVPLQR